MDIIKSKILTPEMVEFINQKLSDGMTLEQVVLEQYGQANVTKRVVDKVSAIEKKLGNKGYILTDGIYKIEEIKKENEVVSIESIEIPKEEILKVEKKSEPKQKRKYATKKKKADDEKEEKKQKMLHENPYIPLSASFILSDIDDTACEIADGKVKNVGVYLMPEVSKSFENLKKRFYYVPAYLLINVAIRQTHDRLIHFHNSKWIDAFTKLYQDDQKFREFELKKFNEEIAEIKNELGVADHNFDSVTELHERLKQLESSKKRKQMNLKMSVFVTDCALYMLKHEFPFLSQSDIINMCVYSFSECVSNYNEYDYIMSLED